MTTRNKQPPNLDQAIGLWKIQREAALALEVFEMPQKRFLGKLSCK